jgi:hypothetical protein
VDAFAGEGIDEASSVPDDGGSAAGDESARTTEGEMVPSEVGEVGGVESVEAAGVVKVFAEGWADSVFPATDADVDVVTLGENPAVAAGNTAELERDLAFVVVRDAVGVVDIALEGDGAFEGVFVAEVLADDAVGTVRADDDAGVVGVAVACLDLEGAVWEAADELDGVAVAEVYAGLLGVFDEEMVESRALSHVGDGAVVEACDVFAVAEPEMGAEDGVFDDRFEGEGEQFGCADGDAAAAGLVAGEFGAVYQEDAGASVGDFASGSGSGWAGADDDDVGVHVLMLRRGRVGGRRGWRRARLRVLDVDDTTSGGS